VGVFADTAAPRKSLLSPCGVLLTRDLFSENSLWTTVLLPRLSALVSPDRDAPCLQAPDRELLARSASALACSYRFFRR